MSLETSSENPAAWKCCMRAFMRTDGTTSRPRCYLVEAAGLDDTGENEVDPHTVGSGAETTAEMATMGRSV